MKLLPRWAMQLLLKTLPTKAGRIAFRKAWLDARGLKYLEFGRGLPRWKILEIK